MQPAPPGPYSHLLDAATGQIAQAAWLVVALWLVWQLPGLVRRARAAPREAVLLASLTLAALALRLWLPWGPLNFGEAERLDLLWSPSPGACGTMCTVPAAALLARGAGVSLEAILRSGPPLAGALGVAGVFVLARAAGMSAAAATAGAAVVLTFPAHAHYSTSLTFSVEGAAVWCFALAAVLVPGGTLPLRPLLCAALLTLGVLTRPEFRLLLVPASLAALFARWSWRERAACAAMLVAALLPYLQYLQPSNLGQSGEGRHFLERVLSTPGLCPSWWVYLAALGLLLGLARRPTRLGTALVTAVAVTLLLVYRELASESNPRWGQWRYFVTTVPFLCFGVAALADALAEHAGRWRAVVAPLLLALAAYTFAGSAHDLRRVEDHVAEFRYLRESAPRVLAGRGDILLLANGNRPELRDVRIELLPRMALATRLGPLALPLGCDATAGEGPRLRDLERIVRECPETLGPGSVVYLGLSRVEERLAALGRYTLVPIEERSMRVALTSWVINKQGASQRPPTGVVEGPRAPDVSVRLGWYRLVPRAGGAR